MIWKIPYKICKGDSGRRRDVSCDDSHDSNRCLNDDMRHDPDGFPRWRSDLDTAADTHGLGRW